MLKSGKICTSISPAGAPILFIPKDHGCGLRLCVNYRGLNMVIIFNRYRLALMNEVCHRVRCVKNIHQVGSESWVQSDSNQKGQ